MKHEELILRGRAFANGDGVMIDPERAYMLWAPIANELTGDDLSLFSELEECFGGNATWSDTPYATAYSRDGYAGEMRGASPTSLFANIQKEVSPDEVREVFDRLMQNADGATLAKVYRQLARLLDEQGLNTKRLKRPEHIRFGNNLGFFMHQYYWNRATFLEKINARLSPVGLSMSSAALSQILNGVHGMNPASQLLLVEMVHEADAANKMRNAQAEKDNRYRRDGKKLLLKPELTRELTSADLHLSLSELLDLYRHPRTDERILALTNAL